MTLRTFGRRLPEWSFKVSHELTGWVLYYRRQWNTFRVGFKSESSARDMGMKLVKMMGLREVI